MNAIDFAMHKIMDADEIRKAVVRWRLLNKKIVFTNGCFDLLHYGHLHYLMEAKSQADILVVGLNSDASVKRLKGKHRPVKELQSRLYALASLFFVDAVIIFEEDTPIELIKLVQPDFLVKGGDWAPEDIVGYEIVLARGGSVKSLPFIEGYSTTKLENKIKSGT